MAVKIAVTNGLAVVIGLPQLGCCGGGYQKSDGSVYVGYIYTVGKYIQWAIFIQWVSIKRGPYLYSG